MNGLIISIWSITVLERLLVSLQKAGTTVMPLSENRLNTSAENYCKLYGPDAYQKIGHDISKAVGNREWDDAYFLQRVQWRVRKLDRLQQITAELGLKDLARRNASAVECRPA